MNPGILGVCRELGVVGVRYGLGSMSTNDITQTFQRMLMEFES